MDVYAFLSVYPYPIGTQVNCVVCTYTTFAQHARWPEFIQSGVLWSKAEEFLFMLHIGDRAASEQPPGALDHIVGSPSFKTTAFEHGDAGGTCPTASKTYHWFLRHLPPVPPSHVVAPELRRPRASHANREVQMLRRSAFSASFAAAHASAWSQDLPPVPNASRPAFIVDPLYAQRRRDLPCHYWAFASQFAPRVSSAELTAADRPTMLVAVPIGWSGSQAAALVPSGGGAFAAPLEPGQPLLQQMQRFVAYLPCHEQPQEMSITRDHRSDIIFALPCVFPITTVGAVHAAHPSTTFASWTELTDLPTDAYVHTAVALDRCRSFLQPGPFLSARVGVRSGPQPVTPSRAAGRYRRRAATMAATADWDDFLREEVRRKSVLLAAFTKADADGLLSPFIANITTAADLAQDLVPPPQGFVAPAVDVVLLAPYPAPPMPLHTSYLARCPPQQAPDGWPPSFAYDEVYTEWARRLLATALNSTAEHDFECFRRGWSERPRHPFIALGPGAFRVFPFADGAGSVRLNQFILETGPDRRLRLMDFSQPTFDHKDLPGVMGAMGFTTDKELLSFLIHGVRWKVEAPRQIRVGHNVFSLKERVKGVGEAIAKLVHKGLYRAFRVRDEHSPLTSNSPCPLATSPQYSIGMLGGADKTDSPNEKRPTGDPATPHAPVQARNSPHGDPDGEWVVNFNDLTGPRGAANFPDGSPTPFPDRETKPRPREVYAANEYIRSLAWINGTFPSCSRDDVRWMFFQFYLEPCEYWLSISYLVIAVCTHCDGYHVLCACPRRTDADFSLHLFCIMPRVMNMGTRPSSKIAVRFSKQMNVEWRARMADFVQSGWLARQSPELRAVLARREASLGYEQAHPFWCTEYTDDFWDVTPEPSLTAHGALTRRSLAREMNLWMSAKACAGTCCDYTGTRCCLTGGFGTVVPAKRARCVADCLAALDNRLTKGELHAHNSYLVHLADVLDLDLQLLRGNWVPSEIHVPDFVVIDGVSMMTHQ